MKLVRSIRKNALFTIFVILLCAWSLGPIVWNVIMSFSPEVNLLSKPPRVAFSDFNLASYLVLFTHDNSFGQASVREGVAFREGLRNSLAVCVIAATLSTVLSLVSGYTFARHHFRGKRFILLMIIITCPIPIVLLAIPLIKIMTTLKLMDTYVGLALLYVSFIIPLTTWMAANYIQTIPQELEDAAHIDGCSRTQSFMKVILPLAAPVIGSIAIITFLAAWGGFFLPLIFAPAGAKQLTVVVAGFVGKDFVKKSLMAAGGTVSMVPPILLVLFFSRFIISGLTKGAVKE